MNNVCMSKMRVLIYEQLYYSYYKRSKQPIVFQKYEWSHFDACPQKERSIRLQQ